MYNFLFITQAYSYLTFLNKSNSGILLLAKPAYTTLKEISVLSLSEYPDRFLGSRLKYSSILIHKALSYYSRVLL